MATPIDHDDGAPDRLCTCGHPRLKPGPGHDGDGSGPCRVIFPALESECRCRGFTPSPDYATAADVPVHVNSATESSQEPI